MIFRGLDLAYKAFRRARFNDNVFTPVFQFNGGQSGKKQQTLQDTIANTIKMPETLTNLSSYQAPKVYNTGSTSTTTAATTANNIGGTTSTLAKNTYLPAYNQLKQTAWWASASDDAKRTAVQYMQDRAFSSTDGVTMTPNGTELDITKAMDFADASTTSTNTVNPWQQFNDAEGWLGLKNSTWQGIGAGLNLANFGLNGILGYLNYRTAKKAMEQQNAYNHATYAANAKAYNTKLRSGNYIGRALAGDNYTDEMRAADDAGLKAAQVSETY